MLTRGRRAAEVWAWRHGPIGKDSALGLTSDIVDRALGLELDQVPEAALSVAERALADTLAVALAGRGERVVRAVRDFAAPGEAGAAAVWGSRRRTDPSRAALVNGTASHALDFDDVCWAMNAHASAVLWPAALATAEATDASGEAALLGYVTGFEAAADVGRCLGAEHYAAGFHPTATIGALAAAVCAGKILGLDTRHLARAIGIACSQSAGSRLTFGTDAKPLHAGLAAQAGVTAALLARAGVTAPEEGIDGPMGLGALLRGGALAAPRRALALLDPGLDVKPYPSCRFTHRIIDGVLAVRARARDRQPAVASIECEVDPFSTRILVHDRPRIGQEAKFSMQYCAAITWLEGWPDLAAFDDDRVAAKDVCSLVARVTLRPGSPDAERVRVTYADGTTDEETVRSARGSPARPLSDAELHAKVERCTGSSLAPHGRDTLIPLAMQIRDPGALHRLSGLLTAMDT